MLKKEIPILSSYFKYLKILWTPVSTGVTTFYESIILHRRRNYFPFTGLFFPSPSKVGHQFGGYVQDF